MSKMKKPLLTFGVITDVQYAECENCPASYNPTLTRFYRNALNQVDRSFTYWKHFSMPVSFALQLGDIIDGLNSVHNTSHSALSDTLSKFESHNSIPTFHTVGNHELYNFKRKELSKVFHNYMSKAYVYSNLNIPSPPSFSDDVIFYYSFSPMERLKFISLDCFDVSVLGYESHHPRYKEAATILEHYHHHRVFEDWDCSGDLQGLDVRFQQMNGAVGKEQLAWLDRELEDADKNGQKVIVFGHVCLSPDSADWTCLLWNYKEVTSTFHKHHCVIAYFSGHSHAKGYSIDSKGIHYVVFTGIIETSPHNVAFSTVSIFEDRIEVMGQGREESYFLSLPQAEIPIVQGTVALEEATSRPVGIEV